MIDPYVYKDTGTLINKLGIKDYNELRKAEGDITFAKLLTVDKDVDCTKFDLQYIKNIHKYVLDDIFNWAGEFRTVPMEKSEDVLNGMSVEYAYPTDISKKCNDVINEINRINWNAMNLDTKSENFTKLIAKLWQVHPFRDGNTRTITTYAFRFAEEHGFEMDKNLLLDNFDYVRRAFVMASIGKYAQPEYLTKIVKDSIERKAKEKEDTGLEIGE